MCRNGAASSLLHWVDSGSIAAQYGLSKWVWINQYHLFINILLVTHLSQEIDSLFKVTRRVLYTVCYRTRVFKTR